MVLKVPRKPPHEGTIDLVHAALARLPAPNWSLRIQQAITLSDSEPEPDLALVRGTARSYLARHPSPADVGLLVKVTDSSSQRDHDDKGRIYARVGIPVYWIVNLVEHRVEVYEAPSGATATPGYGQRQDHAPESSVSLLLDGLLVRSIPVLDLLP